ncbi:hypothetical protein TCAL_15586, partial [Tigriopus californicus]
QAPSPPGIRVFGPKSVRLSPEVLLTLFALRQPHSLRPRVGEFCMTLLCNSAWQAHLIPRS